MTEAITSATWGTVAYVDGGEAIRPATREEWAIGGPFYDGTGAIPHTHALQVVNGPEMLPCGHTRQEHSDEWRPLLEEAATAIAEDMAWQNSDPSPDRDERVDGGRHRLPVLCSVAVIAVTLFNSHGRDIRSVLEYAIERGRPSVAVLMDAVCEWCFSDSMPWDLVLGIAAGLSPEDWGLVVAIGSFIATEAEMTPDEVRRHALSLLDSHNHG